MSEDKPRRLAPAGIWLSCDSGGRRIAAPAAPGGGAGRAVTALLLAAIIAATVVFGVRHLDADFPRWLLWAGAALAGLGLLALLSLVAGLLRLGGERNDRGFLDALTAAIGHPLVVTDGDGRAVYANAAYQALASKSGRLVGMDALFAPFAEFSAPVYQLAQAVAEGRSETRELRVAQGAAAPCAMADRPVWVKLSATPVRAGNRPLRLWQLEDISEDRARQEQAFSRLQFIITYLDNAPAGFFSTLSDGQVDYINATLAQWLGIDLTEAQNAGMKLADMLGEQAARLVSGVAPKPGTAVTESFGLDLRNATTGKLIPVQLIHHVEFDAEGQPLPSRTIVVPRHLAGTSAAGGEISAPRLSRFINNAPIGIAEIDKDGIVRLANGAFIDLSPKARAQRALHLHKAFPRGRHGGGLRGGQDREQVARSPARAEPEVDGGGPARIRHRA
ncbi:MAG: hypothetical protein NTZ54_11255 [Alphaproteobacteria bacterium]|nr:hypothetical protein [Alphaproteobacteria bacterium]